MKNALVTAAVEGFLGSFVLAGALVAAFSSGIWRVISRLFVAFVNHKPLQISPGHEMKVP